jgi:class 3 adenylate cyclase/CHASE2 domain-containing sensor protein
MDAGRLPPGAALAPKQKRERKAAPVSGLQLRTLLLALLLWLLTCASYYLPPLASSWENLETLASVQRFKLRGQQPLHESIRTLAISEQFLGSLAEVEEGGYPLQRDLQAVVLRRLADAGAKVVVVDILFTEELSWDDAEDTALRDALLYCQQKGCRVVLAAAVDTLTIQEGSIVENVVLPAPIINSAEPTLAITNAEHKLDYKLGEVVAFNIDDAIIEAYTTRPIVSLPVMGYWQWLGDDPHNTNVGRVLAGINYYLINYSCDPSRYPGQVYGLENIVPEVFNAAEWSELDDVRAALKSAQPNDLQTTVWNAEKLATARKVFDGTVVFYGSRNPADNDYFNTPFGMMFGVDTLVQSFDTLLRQRLIKPVDPKVMLALALVLALLAWRISGIRPMRGAIAVGVTTLALLAAADVVTFARLLYDFPLALTTAAFAFPFLACTIYGGAVEEAERRKIRATFSRYMSDELVAQLVSDPHMADLGGQRLEVAVMFVDIRNYSTLSEQLDPHQTVWMLNTLLGAITDVIRSHDGFVDKYLGDGLLACFGGPVRTDKPAQDAVAAALEMLVVLHRDVNPKLAAVSLPELRIGIGLHYGPVVMGNIGSESRMDFTVVGDSVNVAARVESCTKEQGWAILVTREVTAAAPGFQFELVDEQLVKGRVQPVQLYRPVHPELGDRLRL